MGMSKWCDYTETDIPIETEEKNKKEIPLNKVSPFFYLLNTFI